MEDSSMTLVVVFVKEKGAPCTANMHFSSLGFFLDLEYGWKVGTTLGVSNFFQWAEFFLDARHR